MVGARSLGGVGSRLLDWSDRLDASLYGYRAKVVGFGALLTVVASVIDDQAWPRTPWLTAVSTYVFLVFLTMLFAARLGALRDDDGNWSFALVFRRAGEVRVALGESVGALGATSGATLVKSSARASSFLALLALAFRNVAVLLNLTVEEFLDDRVALIADAESYLLYGGVILVGFGAFLHVIAWWLLRRAGGARLRHPDHQDRERIQAALQSLPPVIDCGDAAQARELARRAGHPILEQLLESLAGWKPQRFDYEDQYQGSLYRLLRRKMPSTNPQREYPMRDSTEGRKGLKGRADLVVSDAVLIEMKRRLTTSTAQRALGQLHMYLKLWSKGPVILVLCDAEDTAAVRFLSAEVAALRSRAPVLLVLAARSGR